jgi:hypothetical protein
MTDVAEQPVERRERSYAQMVVFVPGIAALGLALLYATGALIKTAQLRESGIRVEDGLPLVPIEQLLAMGIGTVTSAFLLLAAWGLAIAMLINLALKNRQKTPAERPRGFSPRTERVFAIGSLIVGLALLIVGLTIASIYEVLTGLIALPFVIRAFPAYSRGEVRRMATLLVAAYLSLVGVNVLETWDSPPPLPLTDIQTRDGLPVTGFLIVARDDAWFLTNESGIFFSVPTDRIKETKVASLPSEKRKPVLPIRDWLP